MKFPKTENPKASLLREGKITTPEGYEGSSNSELLTQLFITAVKTGRTFNQLVETTVKPETDYPVVEEAVELWRRVNRFTDVPYDDIVTLYWSMGRVYPLDTVEKHYIIADYYQTIEKTFGNVDASPNFLTLYEKFGTLFNRNGGTDNPIPTQKIINYMLLNKSLKTEGVVLPMSDVFKCSLVWEKEDIFNILRRGTTLSEALKLYEIGFKTVDEVVEYAGAIPEDWINQILQ